MCTDRGQRRIEGAERARDQRPRCQKAGIRQQIAGLEIVGAVKHEIIASQQPEHIVGREPDTMRDDADMRVERIEALGGAVDLRPADIRRGVNDLALQVGERHDIIVDDAERADAGRSQIHQSRRAEPAGADHQDRCPLQRRLPGTADIAQYDVAGVALQFVLAQHRPQHPSHIIREPDTANPNG